MSHSLTKRHDPVPFAMPTTFGATEYDDDFTTWSDRRRPPARKYQAKVAAAKEASAAAGKDTIAAEAAAKEAITEAKAIAAIAAEAATAAKEAIATAATPAATATTNDVKELQLHLQEALADAKQMREDLLQITMEDRKLATQMAEDVKEMSDRVKKMEDYIKDMQQDLQEHKLLVRRKAEEEGKLAEVTKDLQRLVLASGRNVDPSKWLGAETNDELRVGLDV